MKYKLKPGVESFEIVDGPDAGKKFVRDRLYDEAEIPAAEKKKFQTAEEIASPASGGTRNDGKGVEDGSSIKSSKKKKTGGES